MPNSAASGAARSGASATTRRPAGVRSASSRPWTSRATIAAARIPTTCAAASACRARATRGSRSARSVRMQDEPGRGVHRWQVAVQERLEIAHRRREPGRLLDLQGQLPGSRPIGAGADDDDRRHVGEDRRRSPRRRPRRRPRPRAARGRCPRSIGRPARCVGDRGGGHERRAGSRPCGTSRGPSRPSRRRAPATLPRRPASRRCR